MGKAVVFLDTSIFITALLSSTGGSFYILNTFASAVDFKTNEYVLQEIEDVLVNKFSDRDDLRTKLFLLLGTGDITILPNRPKSEVIKLHTYISAKDAPILAAALNSADYLLTLDNEFLKKEIIELSKNQNLTICKPKEFIEILRK